MSTIVFAVIGMKALWLTYAWLVSCVVCGALARRKGYSERAGVATGFALAVVGVLVWLVWPARADDGRA
jgi:hypothetical protein